MSVVKRAASPDTDIQKQLAEAAASRRTGQQSTSIQTRHLTGEEGTPGTGGAGSHFNIAGQCLGDAEARSVIPWEIQDSSMISPLNVVRPRQIVSEVC